MLQMHFKRTGSSLPGQITSACFYIIVLFDMRCRTTVKKALSISEQVSVFSLPLSSAASLNADVMPLPSLSVFQSGTFSPAFKDGLFD